MTSIWSALHLKLSIMSQLFGLLVVRIFFCERHDDVMVTFKNYSLTKLVTSEMLCLNLVKSAKSFETSMRDFRTDRSFGTGYFAKIRKLRVQGTK